MSPKEYVEPVAIQMYKRSQAQEQSYLKMISHFSIYVCRYINQCAKVIKSWKMKVKVQLCKCSHYDNYLAVVK